MRQQRGPCTQDPRWFWFWGLGWRWAAGGGSSGRHLPYLDVPDADLSGATLHIAVVATAGAALHLHAGRPHHKVGVGAVHHVAGDFKDHLPRLALCQDSWLCCCQSIYGGPREEGKMKQALQLLPAFCSHLYWERKTPHSSHTHRRSFSFSQPSSSLPAAPCGGAHSKKMLLTAAAVLGRR